MNASFRYMTRTFFKYFRFIVLILIFIKILFALNSLHHNSVDYITSTPVWGPNPEIPEDAYNSLAKDVRSPRFERAVDKLFKIVEKEKERFWIVNTSLTEVAIDVKVKPFLLEYENENAWKNRREIFYDPRFTLSIYLNHIKQKVVSEFKGNEDGPAKIDLNKVEKITLPFNWVDWMDLTILNSEIKKSEGEKYNCSFIRTITNNDPDTSYFCHNTKDLSDDEVAKFGYSRDQLPGFVIHNHASHDDRTYNDWRIMEGRCYALTHLPKPYKVIILNDQEIGGTIEFDVDQKDNMRLANSNFVLGYLKSHHISTSDMPDDFVIHLNHLEELKSFNDLISPYQSRIENEGFMYSILGNDAGDNVKEVFLNSERFHYRRQEIDQQIQHFESLIESDSNALNVQEKNYYEGLNTVNFYEGKEEPTYFKMAVIRNEDEKNLDKEYGWHYDWRFFNGALNYDKEGWTPYEKHIRTNILLDRLLRNWGRFAMEKGIIFWIMHGPLLSWYWDGLMFPFDVDIDIQMPVRDLLELSRLYNQTLVVENPVDGYGKYLIDVGTFIHNRGISKDGNHIDARFIDIDSGLYIDITGLSSSTANILPEYFESKELSLEKGWKDADAEVYNDRRRHFYKLEDLSPLRTSSLGGVPVFIPSDISARLRFEYSSGISSYNFNGWFFVQALNLWIHETKLAPLFEKDDISKNGKIDGHKLLEKVQDISDQDLLYLLDDDEVLSEFYLTKKYTDLHRVEWSYLFDASGEYNDKVSNDPVLRNKYEKLMSAFKLGKPMRKALYDYENIERLKRKSLD